MDVPSADTLAETWQAIAQSWSGMLLGAGLLLVAVGAGSALANAPGIVPVRMVNWWVRKIALTVFRSRSAAFRLLVIFSNNVTVLAILVIAGVLTWLGIVAVAVLGMNIGIGIRVLAKQSQPYFEQHASVAENGGTSGRRHNRVVWGMALNLLEPVAILIALGLALTRAHLGLPASTVWWAFAIWIVPLLMIAAAGEALWIGAVVPRQGESNEDNARNVDSSSDEPFT